MLRVMSILAIGLTLMVAAAHYAFNYDTRRLEIRLQADERLADKLAGDIAVLRAERAYLARPERIEPAARALGLVPARGQQYVRLEALGADVKPGAVTTGIQESKSATARTADR